MLILRYKILLVLTILVNINTYEPKYYLYTQITMFNLFGFVYSYSLPNYLKHLELSYVIKNTRLETINLASS